MIQSDHFHVTMPYLSLFVRLFAGRRQVLDLGCGQGAFLELLRRAGMEPVGVEFDADLAKDARARGLRVVCADALEYLDSTEDRFDGVFCSHVVEHLDYSSVIQLVENVCRLLVPGGRLVLVTPNPESLSARFGFWRTLDHVRPYYRDTLVGILRHYRFEIPSDAPGGSVWRDCRPALTWGGVPENHSWLVTTSLRKLRRLLLAGLGLGYVAKFLDAPHDIVIVADRPVISHPDPDRARAGSKETAPTP